MAYMYLYFKRRSFRLYLNMRQAIARLSTLIFACLIRLITGIHVLPQEIRAGLYNTSIKAPQMTISDAKVSEDALSLAKDLYEESRTRIASVATKVGALLTVTGIAVSGTLASLSLIGMPSTWLFDAVFLCSVLVFLCTGWFLFQFLGVGRMSAPRIDQEFLDLEVQQQKTALLRSLLSAVEQNDRRNNFLVDIYKAGRKLCAFSCACALLLITMAVLGGGNRDDHLLLKLRSDPQLIELLRGPRGVPGPQGVAGPAGLIGAKGEKVDQGPKGDSIAAPDAFKCSCPRDNTVPNATPQTSVKILNSAAPGTTTTIQQHAAPSQSP